MKHLGSLESTQEARVALGLSLSWSLRIFRALQTSQVLHSSMNTRWRLSQLFYNIFNPMENFFSRDLFADAMSVRNRDMKHARAIEFD